MHCQSVSKGYDSGEVKTSWILHITTKNFSQKSKMIQFANKLPHWLTLNFSYPLGMSLGEHFWKWDDSKNHTGIFLTQHNILSGACGRINESKSQWTLRLQDFSVHHNHPEGFSNCWASPPYFSPPIFYSADQMALRWDTGSYLPSKFSSDAASLVPHLENHCFRGIIFYSKVTISVLSKPTVTTKFPPILRTQRLKFSAQSVSQQYFSMRICERSLPESELSDFFLNSPTDGT